MFEDKSVSGGVEKCRWFGLLAGKISPEQRQIISVTKDSICVSLTGFGHLPLHAAITYYLSENSLQVDCRFWVDSPVEFMDGLSFDIETGLNNIFLTTPNLHEEVPDHLNPIDNFSELNPIVTFSDYNQRVSFLCRNPFHSFWEFNTSGNGKHRIHILKCLEPINRTNAGLPESPQICSMIGVGDTIYRHFEVFNSEPLSNLFYWGEHKNGYSQAITMFWDELPNVVSIDNWHFMTTSDADDVMVDHYLVRLLDEHPDLKMGYLLLPDRILYRLKSDFKGWKPNSPFIIPDSLDEYSDNWCCNIIAVDTGRYEMVQEVICTPESDIYSWESACQRPFVYIQSNSR